MRNVRIIARHLPKYPPQHRRYIEVSDEFPNNDICVVCPLPQESHTLSCPTSRRVSEVCVAVSRRIQANEVLRRIRRSRQKEQHVRGLNVDDMETDKPVRVHILRLDIYAGRQLSNCLIHCFIQEAKLPDPHGRLSKFHNRSTPLQPSYLLAISGCLSNGRTFYALANGKPTDRRHNRRNTDPSFRNATPSTAIAQRYDDRRLPAFQRRSCSNSIKISLKRDA